MRWSEEVLLLIEEMRRVKAFLQWQGKWWMERGFLWQNLGEADHEGITAYAMRQMVLRQALLEDFEQKWKNVLEMTQTPRHPDVMASLVYYEVAN
jgi:hypothetical protein